MLKKKISDIYTYHDGTGSRWMYIMYLNHIFLFLPFVSMSVLHSQNNHCLGANYLPRLSYKTTITIKLTIQYYTIRDSNFLLEYLPPKNWIYHSLLVFKLFIKISVSYAYKHVANIMI